MLIKLFYIRWYFYMVVDNLNRFSFIVSICNFHRIACCYVNWLQKYSFSSVIPKERLIRTFFYRNFNIKVYRRQTFSKYHYTTFKI